MGFRRIELNELPRWSPWPARLLGLEEWNRPVRDRAKVDLEYDKDKYAKLLALYRAQGPNTDPSSIRETELTTGAADTVAMSLGADLVVGRLAEMSEHFSEVLVDALRPAIDQYGAAVELGCGWGYNLWKLSRACSNAALFGFDYSENACQIAREIFARISNIHVAPFDYYADRYDHIFREVRARGFQRVVVYTAQSIEQLPSAGHVITVLRKHADQIGTVFHLEPVFELHTDDLIGLLRRAYAVANDYNRDLYTQLQQPDIRVLRADADVLGYVPLNPISVLNWEFSK